MSLRVILVGMFTLIFTLTFFTGALVVRIETIVEQYAEAAERRYLSYQTADELRQSSDDLTRLARTYVVTGNPMYEQMYQAVLDIRNGLIPRPEDYHLIYWDLVAEFGDKPKPDGAVIPLSTRMEQLGFTDTEFDHLAEAQANSDGLVNLEVEAMNAVKGIFMDPETGEYTLQGPPDMELARSLLHSPEYHQEKAQIMEPVDLFFNEMEARTRFAAESKRAEVFNAVVFSLIMAVVVLVTSLIAFFVVKRFVAAPVMRLYKSVLSVHNNGGQETLDKHSPLSQFEKLQERAHLALENIRQTVQQVRDSAHNVNMGATEIAVGNDDLSRRTDSQASSVVEISSSMRLMTDSTKSNAKEAENAEILARAAKRQSQDGSAVVVNAVDAMDAITQSSKKISDILGVIDEIAFQTNLLALNAAVEAARAGEQGRGFSVVASEVRNLAQRSSSAAKDIKELIEDSLEKVEIGTLLVGQTGDALQEINRGVTEVNQIIERVAENTREQADGIAQVNQSISILDDVTQQNAALVEQTAASSSSVAQQAHHVVELMAVFATNDQPAYSTKKKAPRHIRKREAIQKRDDTIDTENIPSPDISKKVNGKNGKENADSKSEIKTFNNAETGPDDNWERF